MSIANLLRRINPVYQWNIHSKNYGRKTKIREAIFNHPWLKNVVTYGTYSSPQAGYEGWYDLPGYGCLAFKDTDGKLNFSW